MSARTPGRRKIPWDASGLPEGLLPPEVERPPTWHARAIHLVNVYNSCVLRLKRRFSHKRATHGTCEVFYALDLWCAARGVDTSAWIYAVFASLSWQRPVGVRDLFAEGRQKTYETLSNAEWQAVAGTDVSIATTTALDAFRPLRDLHGGAEVAKQHYAARGDHALCMINIDITLGHHSQSDNCKACPLSTQCRYRTEALRAEMASRLD